MSRLRENRVENFYFITAIQKMIRYVFPESLGRQTEFLNGR